MQLLCKQTYAGALPADSNFHRGENEIQARLITSAFVGATPTPATRFRETIPRSDCRSGVMKQRRKRRTGALPAFPISLDPWLKQQSAPLSAGWLRVQVPSGPPDLFYLAAKPAFKVAGFASLPTRFKPVGLKQRAARQPTQPAEAVAGGHAPAPGVIPGALSLFRRCRGRTDEAFVF